QRRPLLRPHRPGRPRRPGSDRSARRGAPGGARGPRAPRTADPRGPRRQEPPHRTHRAGARPAVRDRRTGGGRHRAPRRPPRPGGDGMKHFISIGDLTRDEAPSVLATAEHVADTQSRASRTPPTLVGTTALNLFSEDSTRTRISYESAAKRLSSDVINFSAKGSSLSKGESFKDTALTLQAMGADAVVVRSGSSGAAHLL